MPAAPYLTTERRRGASTLIESLATIILDWCRIRIRDDMAHTATFEITTQTYVGPLRAAELFGGIGPLSGSAPWRQVEREDSDQVETPEKQGSKLASVLILKPGISRPEQIRTTGSVKSAAAQYPGCGAREPLFALSSLASAVVT